MLLGDQAPRAAPPACAGPPRRTVPPEPDRDNVRASAPRPWTVGDPMLLEEVQSWTPSRTTITVAKPGYPHGAVHGSHDRWRSGDRDLRQLEPLLERWL